MAAARAEPKPREERQRLAATAERRESTVDPFSPKSTFDFLKHAFDEAVKASGLIAFSPADGESNADPQNVKAATAILRKLQTDIAVRMGQNRERI